MIKIDVELQRSNGRLLKREPVFISDDSFVINLNTDYHLSDIIVEFENNGKRITKHYSNIVDILMPKEIIKAGVLNIVVTLLAMGVAIKTWNIEPIILKECNSGFQCYAELEVLKQAIDRKEQTISELIAKINNLEEIATDLKLQVANLWALHEA